MDLEIIPFDVLGFKIKHSRDVRADGIKAVDICTSHFLQKGAWNDVPSQALSWNFDGDKTIIRGDPNVKSAFIAYENVGQTIASVVSKYPSTTPDKIRVWSVRSFRKIF